MASTTQTRGNPIIKDIAAFDDFLEERSISRPTDQAIKEFAEIQNAPPSQLEDTVDKAIFGNTQEDRKKAELIRQDEQRNSIAAQEANVQRASAGFQNQAEAARINREKRRQQLLKEERFIGRREERGVDAFRSGLAQSREGVVGAERGALGAAAEKASKVRIQEGIAKDPEIQRLNLIESGSIAKINKLQETLRTVKTTDAKEFKAALEDFEDLKEELEREEEGKGIETVAALSDEAASNMSLLDFIDFAEDNGVSSSVATGMHAAAKLRLEASQTT